MTDDMTSTPWVTSARSAASRCLISALLVMPVCAATIACGNKAAAPTKKDDAGSGATGASSDAVPLAMPVLGVDHIKRFNFPYGDGRPSYDKAVAAYRKKDWPQVKAAAEAALAKDASHLGAHRLLAAALAQTGEPAAAVDHLVTALAADYYQYAPTLAEEDLKSFMASPHGASVQALADKLAGEYAKQITGGLWLVGRRADFALPRETGVQYAASRGELYAYDRDARRYLRLTHTEHQAVGFVRPSSGNDVAVLGYDKIDRPAKAGDDAPALIARPWVWVFDATTWKPVTQRIVLPSAREVSLGYGPGDQLLVSTAPASGRWATGEAAVSSVDKTTSKLTKVATGLPASRIVVSLDDSQVVRIPDGVVATWSGDPPVAASLKEAQHDKPIAVPESGAAAQASVARAPDGNHLVFATAADPCAKDAAPSLYVADTKTATFKHLLSARSRFATRWLGPSLLAYEDGDNAIRLWDAATGREALRIDDKAGLALDVLSVAAAPLCKQAPPVAAPAAPAGDDLPTEEPSGSAAPVTAPQ